MRGGYLPSANLEQAMGFLTTEQLAVHLGLSGCELRCISAAARPSRAMRARLKFQRSPTHCATLLAKGQDPRALAPSWPFLAAIWLSREIGCLGY